MYKNKETGATMSTASMQAAADRNGMNIAEYAEIAGYALQSEDEPQDFPTSTVEDADAVQQPMTASQAGFTESLSVDTPSDSQDPKPAEILPPGVDSIDTSEEEYNKRLARLNIIDDKRNKLKDQLIQFAKTEIKDEQQASDYIKKNLEDFDKNNQTEKDLIFSNKKFELQQKALEQLRKDTGSNKAAGRGFGGGEDVIDYFKYIGRAFGVIDLRTEEASEVIKINKDVETAIATSLPKKDLQKLAMGVYTLQEKENLINEYKLPIIQKKTKDLSDEMLDLKAQAENSFGEIKNRQIEINKELSIIKNRRPNQNYTQEEVNKYNELSAEFKQLEDSKPALSKKFEDNFKAINIRKEILEGDYNVNLSKNVIYNNFELTNQVEKYREQFSGEGFWNAASDILVGDILGGIYSTIKKGTIGGATFFSTAYFDAFTDQDSYNRIDGFRDLITNFTDYSLVPSSEDEKFSITKEEGGFKDDVSARSLLKLGAQMVPFTGYLMMEARKGNMSGVKQGVGKYLQGLKGSAKILTPLGKSLKNEVILADAAFRATILDNAKEAKNKGLDGVAANAYATTISLTEGVVQSIMPDVNFLKGTQGKAIKDAFVGSLKNVANKKAASTAAKEFFTNIGKEFVEEEITYGLNLMTDTSFGLALPKGSEFLNAQIELAAGTIMLSGGMGTVGGVKTFSNQKKLIYNQISNNIESTDAYLQKMQETVTDPDIKEELKTARNFAGDIHKAIKKSPENVTAEQIELLVEKSKLLKEKENTDSAFHESIDNKISNINDEIKQSTIQQGIAKDFEKDIKLLNKSIESSGLKVDDTIVFEGEGNSSASSKQKEFLMKEAGYTEEKANASKDSYGLFVTTKDGRDVLVVNKDSSLQDAVVTTGQHEFMHKILKQALNNDPSLIEKASKSLLEEVTNIIGGKEAVLGTKWAKRWMAYNKKVEDGTYTMDMFYEEGLPLFSEALTNKDIKLNTNALQKIADIFRQLFQNIGLKNVNFETGEGVKNFIIDYNKAYSKGKFKGALKEFGASGKAKGVAKPTSDTNKTKPKAKTTLSINTLQEQLDDLDISDFDNDEYAFADAKANLELKIKKAEQKELSKPSEPKEKVKSDTKKNEKRIGDQLKEMVPANTTNKEFKEKIAIKVIDDIDRGMLNPLIKKIAAGYGVVADNVYGKSWDDFFTEVAGVQLKKNIMDFNPESNDDLGGYIIGSQYGIRNRIKEALAKFKKEGEGGFKEDVSVAKNVIAREDAAPQEAEKRKYVPLIKSNIVPNFTITAITEKLTQVLASLESKITAKRGDNSATTPLVAEIKKKIGKVVGDPNAAPKLVIQRLGKLKDGTYEKNLIKNKKAIIENMTTTFLMGKDSGKKVSGGIPQAIEKSVGGKFTGKKVTVNVGGKEIVQEEFIPNFVPYPNWVGQKIDREKTLVRGATAGNEIVRRVPADKVSDADFVGLFIDEKGKLIRGKRESLGKAIAEEIAFEILSKEIKNENSDISKAFESNQEALGEMLSDTFVNELQRDLDRGTVKYAMKEEDIRNIQKIAIKEGLTSQKIQEIAVKNKIPINILEGALEKIINEGWVQMMQDITASNNGIKYEKALQKVLNNYTSGKIKIELIKSQKGDIVVKANGKEYKVEVKLNDKAQIGSISTGLFKTTNGKISLISSDNLKINNKLSEDNKKEFVDFLNENKKYLNDLINAINKANSKSTEKATINNNGHIKLPYKEFWQNIKDEMPGKIAGYVSYEGNQSIVEDFYKEIDLMQIGGYGAFAIGNQSNLSGFYQKLEATTNNVLRPVRSTNTVYMRLFPNFKQIQNPKGNSLDTAKGIMVLAKNIKTAASLDYANTGQRAETKLSMKAEFNRMLERSTGIAADETISKVIARRKGVGKSKFKVFMPSSLDDFKGLTSYTFAGKGKQGEADQKFFQDNLIDPYFKGIRAIEETRQAFKDDFRALNKQMRPVIKKLGKLVPGTEFTHDQAIRVALWNASGYEIPGLSEIDQKKLVDYVNDNADLSEYARKLQQISKRPKWAKPGDFWDAETILSDLNNLTENVGRKEFLAEFIENADIIFSEDNLNKVQAGYGKATRDALEDILYRMKNGTNRPSSTTDNTNRFNTWINNSIGAIMFFNRRSALLQTLSTVNFINWSDNNPLKAAAAFANQKQYWSDFAKLFNSPKLKQRRSGLKSDVNEAEIARAVKGSKNKAVAALSYLLKIGFTPTQMADSFAIAAGGATFYRNRIKSYLKKVNEEGEALYTKKQAEEMAFKDFSQISEETQQSGDPALISSDQASIVGRVLLAFQNTPIQLNRSIKKAALDIKNRRRTPGQTLLQSDFSNLSKIIYYGTVQNIIFSALQNALFALIPGFEEEDDELTEEEQLEKYGKVYSTKQGRIINGMIDTTLKGGFGLPGAFISTIKNAYQEYNKQEKKEFMADHTYTILALANLAPSVGSKLRKIYSGIQTKKFEKDVIEKRDWDVTIDGRFNLSPSYKVLGSVTEGLTNLPLDRAVTEINALTEALDYRNTVWQRAALALGWRSWDVGAKNEEHELIKTEAKAKRKEEGKEKAKATRALNKTKKKAFYKRVSDALTKEEKKLFFRYKTITLQKKYLEKMAKEKNIK